MVRRAASNATDDSLKENSGMPSSPEQNKGKEVKRERGLRNGRPSARRVRSDNEAEEQENDGQDEQDGEGEEEDAQDEEQGGSGEGPGSPKGRKRARANTNGDAHPSENNVKAEKSRQVTLPRDVDGFLPGSIVRVQLRNFVTYDYVEFCPGPYLNMILGPNGTGKSSIACAICLGLNFPPSVLGRATELNSFVKLGTSDGHIEIELKGRKGEPNLVIRRSLKAISKSSHFTINGVSSSGKEVNVKMAELNVQVSNLCSFLPQDRVAEFARMSPQQLLRETQRAAGNEKLTSWHDTLISAGKELKVMQVSIEEDKKRLVTLEERNANLEREVKRFEERQAIQKKIQLLDVVVPAKQYHEAKGKFNQAKERKDKLLARLKELKAANAPVEAFEQSLVRQKDELGRNRDTKKAETKRKFTHMKSRFSENEKLEGKIDDCKNKLESLKTREKTRINSIKATERNIGRIEQELENLPELESPDAINDELKSVRHERRQLQPRQNELQERQRRCIEEEARHKAALKAAQISLQQLDDVSHRKLQVLRDLDENCAEVVLWLRQNQSRFKMEVMEPPILSVTVPTRAYAQAVENFFSNTQLRTFVMQCDEDYKLFNHLVIDTGEALGYKVNVSTWARPNSEIAPLPVSPDDLRELGFDGYAMDFMKYPDGLTTFLKADMQLHRFAIGLNPRKIDSNKATEIIGRSGSARFIIGNTMNSLSRSRYGKQFTQNQTWECRPVRVFGSQNVDPARQRKHQEEVDAANRELALIAEQVQQLSQEERQLRDEDRVFKDQETRLNQRRTEIIAEATRIERLRITLGTQQQKLSQLQNAPPVDQERARLKNEILSHAKARLRIATDYRSLVRAAIDEQTEATKLSLQWLQVSANLDHVKALSAERGEKLEEHKEIYARAKADYLTVKDDATEKKKISIAKLDELEPDVRGEFESLETTGEIQEKSAEEWAQELENERQRLEIVREASAGSVDQYHERKKAIEALQAAIDEKAEKIQKKERAIKIARDNWEPALTKLVESVGERFSAAFDRIGCAGEIKVSQHEDYDKWAIDILVKFRDNEKLQLLTGERQSGGERSLTTIMYLMSLTEEARTPFSLVDEINQGMDARAERAVHNSLVEVTCKAESGQYFLITPKLLPDLNYHERMKVLCVNNGEWLPEDVPRGDMMSMIDTFVRVSRGGGTSAA